MATTESTRRWRAANPEKAAARDLLRAMKRRQYRIDHPEECRARDAREREKYAETRATVMRRWALRVKYGISLADYEAILERQGGGCAICGATTCPAGRLAVDHSHGDGVVRGILCSYCNRAIGLFKDDPARLLAAAVYLERHAPPEVSPTTFS